MDKAIHHFSELFAQLGLPDDDASIADFLATHTAITACKRLADAPYWTPAQAQFLTESLSEDSNWSGLVDQLSQALLGDPQSQSCSL